MCMKNCNVILSLPQLLISLHASVDTVAAVELLKEADLSSDVNTSEQLNIHVRCSYM